MSADSKGTDGDKVVLCSTAATWSRA